MKIIHITNSNHNGGAGIAAYRIHQSLKSYGCNSIMWVNVKRGDEYDIIDQKKIIHKVLQRLKIYAAKIVVNSLKTSNSILHSPQIFSSSWVKLINKSDADIIHLHWVQHEMLSISDISKIKKPLVWTFHDMWPICGAEHVSYDNRWMEGYTRHNRPNGESGYDLNRWVWKRKKRNWKHPIQIVAPSKWMKEIVNRSLLMKNWPVEIIPNPLNLDIWKPMDQKQARDCFNLPQNIPLILFGAIGGTSEFHKGYDLLRSALEKISYSSELKNLRLVVFGQSKPEITSELKFPIIYLGPLNDSVSLRAAYCSCNSFVVPSRIESFGQTASEAQACGIPVVAFNSTGLQTTIAHKTTGYLAEPFDVNDLANGIMWSLKLENDIIRKQSRDYTIERFSYSIIGHKYKLLYERVLKELD